jgi:DNA polymerase
MVTKKQQYDVLVTERKACRSCTGLRNPAEPALRQFDSSEIGPWSRLHGDLDAQLMIVGQDWGDVKYYTDNKGLDKLTNPTMRNLEKLLHHIGVNVRLTTYADQGHGVFLTNAVVCLKTAVFRQKLNLSGYRTAAHFSCGNRLKLFGQKWWFALEPLPSTQC